MCDQKRVFPYDGEHAHFMQASDKSCLASQFMPGETGVISSLNTSTKDSKVEQLLKKTTKLEEEVVEMEDEDHEVFEIQEIDEIDVDPPLEAPELSDELPVVEAQEEVDPNDFREKIKRRLQKALQNKKKWPL